jgi:NAD(P)-dependent dehydrogenase (short-subunit alcohol dehydrogenase family)
MLNLEGRGVLIVGARRIGEVVTRRLAQERVNLAIAYRNSKNQAEELIQSLPSGGTNTLVQGDLTVEESVRQMVASAAQNLGDLSFVVNMASDYPRSTFDTLDASAWDVGMASAKGSYLLAVHAGRRMMENQGPTRGHIVMFGDWAAGETPYTDYLPYLTGKAAIQFMTRAFAAEMASHGVLVNAIAPGPVRRPHDFTQREWDEVLSQTPLRRESSADEMAEIIVTLLRSETITGETIRVDSGRHLVGP